MRHIRQPDAEYPSTYDLMELAVEQGVGIVAAAAAAISTGIAAVQLALTRRDSNRRQAIELIRDMGTRLEALHTLDLAEIHETVASAYRDSTPLNEGGRTYLSFLQSVELLADARHNGGVDKDLADKYLASVIRSDVIPLEVLNSIQRSLGDTQAFSNTRLLLEKLST